MDLRFWIRKLWSILSRTQLSLLANSLSFTTLLSLIPFLAVIFALTGMFDLFEFIAPKIEHLFLDHFKAILGASAASWVRQTVTGLQDKNLGFWGTVFLILGSLQILRDLDLGTQLIFGQKNRKSAWRRYLLYWIALLALPLAAAVFVTLTKIPFLFGQRLGFTGDGWLFVFVVLLTVQKIMPPIRVQWRHAVISSFVSLAGLFVLQSFFGMLTKKVFNYSKIYGSFAALPALMIYLVIAWNIILAGFIVNSVLAQNRTRRLRQQSLNESATRT